MTTIDTGTEDLLAAVDDGVAVITMNRPARRNAFSNEMVEALAHVLARVETDDAVGCVVLTGAGGAFSAGGDVKAMADRNAGNTPAVSIDSAIHRQRLSQQATSGKLWRIPKPTIAQIPGPVAGAGLGLALACDLRYAADTAVFTTAFARVGFAGDYGGTWFLTRLVGSAKAKELYYFSERLSAAQAEALGIVNAVFSADDLQREVMERARRLAKGPSVAFRYMKENLNRAVHGGLEECMDLEATHHLHTGLTADHQEAALAFVEKREPRFRGR
ncbi:MAG: enoyl-CoA hydratase/isomerase family protein [Mycobacterium sp.]|nr:enoyl-CoA hydratase/isomerase family protein [Mycobacterium sp.]MBV9722779.1 enoyl-CoA hydratase/isomerase family protein [Mycobacterium sp.]